MGQAQRNDRPVATALVVEDDPLVRLVVCSALEDLGMAVVEADDGLAGLAVLRENAAIDLIVTDLTMPNMDGATMIAQARKLRPDLKVLATSGREAPPPGEAFLQKPYRASLLQAKVIQLLNL
jgi:CheY-like chemotaxis protein